MPAKIAKKEVIFKRTFINAGKEYLPNQGVVNLDDEGIGATWEDVFKKARRGLWQIANPSQAQAELKKELAGK